jgi:hypothetical protein
MRVRRAIQNWAGGPAVVAVVAVAVIAGGCSGSTHGSTPDLGTSPDGTTPPDAATTPDDALAPPLDAALPPPDFAHASAPATFNVFDHIPQFGIYTNTNPTYTPPAGVLMWSFGTVFVTKLSLQQQTRIGADLAARITYHAQCDNYDRLGGLFFIIKPLGQAPQPTDPRIEIVRFITPFSDYQRGALATHVYPNADLAPFAASLSDGAHDIWVGIAGGSNPYNGDPCTNAGVSTDFAAVGFKYSLDFVSTKPLTGAGASVTLSAFNNLQATSVPVAGSFQRAGGAVGGHVTVIVSGHGSAAGGDEYQHTQDTVALGGHMIGNFSTQIDCAPFAQYSPDGNPGIFQNNLSGNPRNWCPGALVPSHTFAATLTDGKNDVSLAIDPPTLPGGSYYATSITFTAP